MCRPSDDDDDQTHGSQPAAASRDASSAESAEAFPWHLGVCDAHCHPTDTMSSLATVGDMKARVLTVMATRAQDQELVASAAAQHGIRSQIRLDAPTPGNPGAERVVPAFGWHPWFSHQLYDDKAEKPTYDPSQPAGLQKADHYAAVLNRAPDPEFIDSLPEPRPLSELLTQTRQRLEAHPFALIGEIGLDKPFRLPAAWKQGEQAERDESLTPGGREGRLLSPYHVKMPHQLVVLNAQIRLAGELGRPVSVHGVQAHGVLFDALESSWKGHEKEVISRRKQRLVAPGAEDFSSSDEEEDDYCYSDYEDEESLKAPPATKPKAVQPYIPKPFPPRICLHSFSGSPQMLSQYLNPAIPASIFFSFSTCVNLSTAGGESKFADVIKACPDDRLLIESDLHCAGDEMDRELEEICRRVCAVKRWTLEEGVRRIRTNYERFLFG